MKRLVVCCDGTWNRLGGETNTNVVLTLSAVLARDPSGVPQLTFYDEGVGAEGHVISRLLGGAIGKGLDKNINDAYRFLAQNYEPGDEVYFFGYSRGAYTARSLAGMIRKCGILKRREIKRANEALELYRNREVGVDGKEAIAFRESFARVVEDLHFLGVWDTVGALGVPNDLLIAPLFNARYQFHDTKLSSRVGHAYHAVSIDEKRASFEPTLWDEAKPRVKPFEQQWFPGVHADVGGGRRERGLAAGAFLWMMEKAEDCGLALDREALNKEARGVDPTIEIDDAVFGLAPKKLFYGLHNFYRFLRTGWRGRTGPSEPEKLDSSAAYRWHKRPDWRPHALRTLSRAPEKPDDEAPPRRI